MEYDFDIVRDRRDSDSVKWNYFEPDVLPMWVADMDFRSPQPIIDSLRDRVEHGFFGYPECVIPPSKELKDLRAAIVDWLAERHRWRIQPEWLVFVPGVVTGFNLAASLLSAQEAILIQTPVYPPILNISKSAGVLDRQMELTRRWDGSYEVDWERFESAITPETRTFLLCNPHNPVGKVFSAAELSRMAEICLRHDVLIISDEIHADLIFSESRHVPIAALADEICKHTITLMAPSKTFNIPGLQCSFAIIADAELRKSYIKARRELVPWINLFGATGALAAYRHGGEWLDHLLPYLQTNRDLLLDVVSRQMPEIKVGCPEGTYLAWLDCRAAPISDSPYRFFLDKARVGLSDGAGFGTGGEGFVRLNFGCPRSILIEGLDRMRAALEAAV